MGAEGLRGRPLPSLGALAAGRSVHRLPCYHDSAPFSLGNCGPVWGCDNFHWSFVFFVLRICPRTAGFLAGLRGGSPSAIACQGPRREGAEASPPARSPPSQLLCGCPRAMAHGVPADSWGHTGLPSSAFPLVVPGTHSLGQRAPGSGSPQRPQCPRDWKPRCCIVGTDGF